MLKQRIITALLLAPILLFIVTYGNQTLFAVLGIVIQAAATYEWLKINRLKAGLAIINGIVLSLFTVLLAGAVTAFNPLNIGIFSQIDDKLLMVVFIIVWLSALIWLNKYRWGYQNTALQVTIKSVLGVIAIMLFAICMYQTYAKIDGKWWTLVLFLLIWVADIGAYFSGKTMGKTKLAINISPGKTWEGVIGAQILVAVYAVVVSIYLDISWQKSCLIMIPVALFSVIGDLAASLGKRQAEVKDSSNLLPGHGGFIDRFDSLIAAAPLYYLLLKSV